MKAISIIRETISAFGQDRGTLLAASIAYYTLLSIFPMALGLLAITGLVFTNPASRARLVQDMASLFPGSESLIRETVAEVVRGRGPAGIVATLGLLWSASGVFSAISAALDSIWRVPDRRGFIASAVLAMGLVLAVGLMVVASLILSTILTLAVALHLPLLGFSVSEIPLLFPLLSLALPFLITLGILASIYRYVPNRRLVWRDVWPGAILAGTLFELGKQIFVWYLSRFAHLNAVYGSIGTVIALLIWSYYAAVVLLLGAELDAVLARRQAAQSDRR